MKFHWNRIRINKDILYMYWVYGWKWMWTFYSLSRNRIERLNEWLVRRDHWILINKCSTRLYDKRSHISHPRFLLFFSSQRKYYNQLRCLKEFNLYYIHTFFLLTMMMTSNYYCSNKKYFISQNLIMQM